MIIVHTDRLVLRHLEPGDLEPLYELYRDPEIRQYYPDGTRTLEETRDELDWFRNGHPYYPKLGLWATVEKSSGAFLGRCGLLPWQIDGATEVELAFMIRKERWREGLASEAAQGVIQYAWDVLELRRLICLITPGNEASVAVAMKVGMRFERDYTDESGLCHIYAMSLASTNMPPPAY